MDRLTDRPDMTLDVYRGRKTTIQQQLQHFNNVRLPADLADPGWIPTRDNHLNNVVFEGLQLRTTQSKISLCIYNSQP